MTGPFIVGAADTAAALGSGDVPVLATPRVIAWLEAATVEACEDLPAGSTSVGTRVDIEHLLATPLGAAVTTRARLDHRDGRLLRFEVTAFHDIGDGQVLVAQGTVTRVVVDRERFLERTAPPRLIRTAVPAEWGEIGELCATAYSAGYGLADDEDDYLAVLRDVAGRAAHAEVLVAREGERLVGTVTILRPGAPMAELAEEGEVEFRFMAVDPAAWGRGLGRALVDAVLARAGGAPVVCSVIVGNEPAAALYRALGFEAAPNRDREPVPGIVLRAYRH
ncbi:MAG: thioesterase, FlK family [bacterium]